MTSSSAFERGLDDVVEVVRRQQARDGIVLLLGAGCSKSAGIPLASELCSIIAKEYPRDYERAKRLGRTGYQQLMGEIADGERRDLLTRFIDEAKLNWGHIALAELVKRGYVARVLTPNFDPLVVQACALVNLFPAIYDLAASHEFRAEFVPTPAVFYLHGQRTGFRLLNTEPECEEHARRLEPVFDEAGARRPWIVIGYSGENDPVFDRLLAGRRYDFRLYWVGYRDGEPPRHLRERLLVEGRQAFWVPGFDADQFLVQLAERLDAFPPDLVGKPFSHLRSSFSLIGSHELQDSTGEKIDYIETARSWVERAIESFEVQADSPEKRASDLATKISGRLISGDFEEAVRLASTAEQSSERLIDLHARALNEWGDRLLKEAKGQDPQAARRLLEQAGGKYADALQLKPDRHDAFNNWGIALADQARLAERDEAWRLFDAAAGKYAQALQIKPDKHEALNNWGLALANRARLAEGDEAKRLFELAAEKYSQALQIKPDKHEALNNWGLALASRARLAEGDEARRLFELAAEKYSQALQIKPDKHEALYNWGNALADQARLAAGDEARRLFDAAAEKYAQALQVKPDKHEALYNWGIALADQAKLADRDEAWRLLDAAIEKYVEVLQIKPEKHESLYNWGNALANQAKLAERGEATRLSKTAAEKYAQALQLTPEMHDALNNWGTALAHQARLAEGDEARRLFDTAAEKYAQALQIKPDKHETLNNWGNALAEQAKRSNGEERHRLFDEADTKFTEAVRFAPSRTYNLACLRALQGRSEEARDLLFRAKSGCTLPSREHLVADEDLESVRDLEWFGELLER